MDLLLKVRVSEKIGAASTVAYRSALRVTVDAGDDTAV